MTGTITNSELSADSAFILLTAATKSEIDDAIDKLTVLTTSAVEQIITDLGITTLTSPKQATDIVENVATT